MFLDGFEIERLSFAFCIHLLGTPSVMRMEFEDAVYVGILHCHFECLNEPLFVVVEEVGPKTDRSIPKHMGKNDRGLLPWIESKHFSKCVRRDGLSSCEHELSVVPRPLRITSRQFIDNLLFMRTAPWHLLGVFPTLERDRKGFHILAHRCIGIALENECILTLPMTVDDRVDLAFHCAIDKFSVWSVGTINHKYRRRMNGIKDFPGNPRGTARFNEGCAHESHDLGVTKLDTSRTERFNNSRKNALPKIHFPFSQCEDLMERWILSQECICFLFILLKRISMQ